MISEAHAKFAKFAKVGVGVLTTKRGEAEVAKADRPQPRRLWPERRSLRIAKLQEGCAPAAAKLRSWQIAIAIYDETIRFWA